MKLEKLQELMRRGGIEKYSKDQIFYALDFKAELYVVNSGYVKRYQVAEEKQRVIESIYGPTYIFPLTQVYKKLFNLELSQESVTYIYQAMTDVEIQGINGDMLVEAAQEDPGIYADLFYEAGRRLRANINRLASNAIKEDDKKVTHQLIYLAQEFGKTTRQKGKENLKIPLALGPVDMAEQLNMSVDAATTSMSKLEEQGLLIREKECLILPEPTLLANTYL